MRAPRAAPGAVNAADVLAAIEAAGLTRSLRTVQSASGPTVELDGREVLLLCSNDYLGLAAHPAVIDGAARAAVRWGAGSGASQLISGHLGLHAQLEGELATFKGAEACVLFGSGFLANTGVIAALAGPGEVVLSDALNHASIVDGCRLAGAETVVYPHADLDALASALRATEGRAATIVTDAVFSMDGDLAPLAGIVALAREHGARVVVDEAHATGVVGAGGRGLVAELGLQEDVVVVGTLSKALGSYGAFCCCSEEIKALLVNRARTLIFSTALPPPSVGAALAALQVLRDEPERLRRLHDNAAVLRGGLREAGFDVGGDDAMPIVPLVVGEAEAATALTRALLEQGVFAQAIRPPTVPDGSSRLRLVAMASHEPAQLRDAAALVGDVAALRSSAA